MFILGKGVWDEEISYDLIKSKRFKPFENRGRLEKRKGRNTSLRRPKRDGRVNSSGTQVLGGGYNNY